MGTPSGVSQSATDTVNAAFTTIGLRASTAFDLLGISSVARGTLGWRYALGNVDARSTARFSTSDSVSVSGTAL